MLLQSKWRVYMSIVGTQLDGLHNVQLRDIPRWDEEKWEATLPARHEAVREYQEEMQLMHSAAAWLSRLRIPPSTVISAVGDSRSLLC